MVASWLLMSLTSSESFVQGNRGCKSGGGAGRRGRHGSRYGFNGESRSGGQGGYHGGWLQWLRRWLGRGGGDTCFECGKTGYMAKDATRVDHKVV